MGSAQPTKAQHPSPKNHLLMHFEGLNIGPKANVNHFDSAHKWIPYLPSPLKEKSCISTTVFVFTAFIPKAQEQTL